MYTHCIYVTPAVKVLRYRRERLDFNNVARIFLSESKSSG